MEFKVGNTYTARSACDYDTVYSWTVTARTAKFITLVEDYGTRFEGETKRVGVKVSAENGIEWALPDGSYSMCPVIIADRPQPTSIMAIANHRNGATQ